VTMTVLANQTMNVAVPALSAHDFTGVVVGDTVFLPGISTGDISSPFSVLNAGFWQVLAVISTIRIVLGRLPGVNFSGTTETQTPTTNLQLQAYSTAGVQAGDVVDISNGFPLSLEKSFTIDVVTSTFFEIVSTMPLPLVTGNIPGISGIVFYFDAKSFLYVEADQEAAVQVNGDGGQSNRLSPIEPNNTDLPGIYMKRGATWSLSIVNRSTTTLNVVCIHAK
jgi:hypothetical protein